MAEASTSHASHGGTKQWMGQPWYVWAAGVGAIAIGYYLIKKQQASQQAAASTPVGSAVVANPSPTGLSLAQFLTWLSDQQSSPAPAAAPAPAKRGDVDRRGRRRRGPQRRPQQRRRPTQRRRRGGSLPRQPGGPVRRG